jgi:uncharacterized protein (TIGR02001 family)
MKKMNRVAAIIVLLVGLAAVPAMTMAQEVSVGADIVSSYVWRGAKFGDGAAVQPCIEFSAGGFALGAWGSFDLANDIDSEADLYVGYGFDFGLYAGLTDYFFPSYEGENPEYLDGDNHTIEANLGYEVGPVSISANMYIDDNSNDDMYFELGYDFGLASIFVGGGDESYTADGDFAICNVGITAGKDIAVTDSFSVPVFASFIVNPDIEQTYMVFGMSF